jgi:hypothetical protein
MKNFLLGFAVGAAFILPAQPPSLTITPYSVSLLSKATDQSGLNKFCNSSTQNTAYACTLNATLVLQQLTYGMTLILVADTNSLPPIAATLWVDQNGSPAPINEKDGITPAQINKGQPYLIFWDGRVWRVIA